MTGHFTDELFRESVPGVTDVIFPVSRLVVEPEMIEDDVDEPMAWVGIGVIYEQTSARSPLRREILLNERGESPFGTSP